MLDTLRSVETPEGIQLELPLAGLEPRFLAWLVDFAIRLGIYLVAAIALGILGLVGVGIVMVIAFLVEWFYPVLFEVLWQGQSPGKRALGLRVLSDDGTPVGWGGAMLRSLVMAVDFLPFLYGAGFLCMLVNRDGKRLGDLAAGTVVVYAEVRLPLRRRASSAQLRPLPPPLPLGLAEQRAIASFAERLDGFTPERAAELAELLEPLTGLRGEAAVLRLQEMAAAITGQGA